MAYKYSGLFLALLIIATTSSVANSLLIIPELGQSLSGFSVVGSLVDSGLPTNCLAKVPVNLLNLDNQQILAHTLTDLLGNFKLSHTPEGDLTFVPSSYAVTVPTPISGCTGFHQLNGFYKALLAPLDLVQVLLGIAQIPIGDFSFIPKI